jgi:hypothetical protein
MISELHFFYISPFRIRKNLNMTCYTKRFKIKHCLNKRCEKLVLSTLRWTFSVRKIMTHLLAYVNEKQLDKRKSLLRSCTRSGCEKKCGHVEVYCKFNWVDEMDNFINSFVLTYLAIFTFLIENNWWRNLRVIMTSPLFLFL